MSSPRERYSWLPEHQLHVAATLGHVDQLIEHAGRLLHDYLQPGPFEFDSVVQGDLAMVTVTAVHPLPTAIPRYVADALTQLRAALEHTLYAEVEHQLGRALSTLEARSIEMPASGTPANFDKWFTHRDRRGLAPLLRNGQLARRLDGLQPFHRRDSANQPLRVLVEHTNHAKHRTPTVAATLLGTVIPDFHSPSLHLPQTAYERPIAVGDVLASGPKYERVPLSIWPKVSVQRPHTGTWHVTMTELGDIESWVRTVAIPIIVVGTTDVAPLPPQYDTTVGHNNPRTALLAAGTATAATRSVERIQASVARESLNEILSLHPITPDPAVVARWVDSLRDEDVLAATVQLAEAAARDPRRAGAAVASLIEVANLADKNRAES